jgi:hypothetical protein
VPWLPLLLHAVPLQEQDATLERRGSPLRLSLHLLLWLLLVLQGASDGCVRDSSTWMTPAHTDSASSRGVGHLQANHVLPALLGPWLHAILFLQRCTAARNPPASKPSKVVGSGYLLSSWQLTGVTQLTKRACIRRQGRSERMHSLTA